MPLLLDDRELVVLARIAERGAQEEAVELRLGQRERPSCSIGFSVASTRKGSGAAA